ncbi:hypothetical protein DIS24_g8131 [Lasiodiplodia hormozganensis]|uniref:DUF7888 domain-containing protein n=1 Tax=Lasiodiplodia hormozganensis TaxID=869390 RepID=A0AA39Y640_9PEZI|nr:hypothetical protein DIS24_g8131 [Lasiodiplodia hormozganensis]
MAVVTILSGAASGIIASAVESVIDLIVDLTEWDDVRKEFTRDTVDAMWGNRTHNYDAAICYNLDYNIADWDRIYEKTAVKLELGLLHTDYDCFFMNGENDFWALDDGGGINLAATGRQDQCAWDEDDDLHLHCD